MKKANLIVRTTAVLRERIFAVAEGERIGSLHELARSLEVGIVTLQQVARVLEHEGLLEVRRGPGGGYYGARCQPARKTDPLSAPNIDPTFRQRGGYPGSR